ncbi:MAG: metalloprotease [Candidatus Nitrosocaldaceae archaeon]|nr:MAG: metalloprotease [Candidatus Nitrosocaldaceae archaeon]
MKKLVVFKREVRDSILTFCKIHHPHEAILILCGNNKKDRLIIERLMVPPLSEHGPYYSGFPTYMLPYDRSIIGTAHSHPSGNATPSLTDLHHFIGLVSVIVRYPYEDRDLFAYNSNGEELEYSIE